MQIGLHTLSGVLLLLLQQMYLTLFVLAQLDLWVQALGKPPSSQRDILLLVLLRTATRRARMHHPLGHPSEALLCQLSAPQPLHQLSAPALRQPLGLGPPQEQHLGLEGCQPTPDCSGRSQLQALEQHQPRPLA